MKSTPTNPKKLSRGRKRQGFYKGKGEIATGETIVEFIRNFPKL